MICPLSRGGRGVMVDREVDHARHVVSGHDHSGGYQTACRDHAVTLSYTYVKLALVDLLERYALQENGYHCNRWAPGRRTRSGSSLPPTYSTARGRMPPSSRRSLEAVRRVSHVPFPPGVPPRRLLVRLPVVFEMR